MATPLQSIDPALLALQTAKKAMPASPSTQQKKKPVLQSNIQQSQAPFATSSVIPTKIGGISSPFGATNINSSPVLGGATPQDIKETATQLQSLPKTMPDTGATQPNMTQSLKDLKATIPSMQSIDDIKGAFPEFSNLDDSVLLDLVETTKNSDNYEDILGVFPELQGGGIQKQGGAKGIIAPTGGFNIPQVQPIAPTTEGNYNPLKTLANAPGSLLNVGINIANMGLSPIQTLKTIAKTAIGGATNLGEIIGEKLAGKENYQEAQQKLLQGEGPVSDFFRFMNESGDNAAQVGDYFKGYADKEELQRRMEEDPAGVLSDVLTVAGYAGGAIQKAGQVSKLGKVAQVGQKIASLEKYDPYTYLPKQAKVLAEKPGLVGKIATPVAGILNPAETYINQGKNIIDGIKKAPAVTSDLYQGTKEAYARKVVGLTENTVEAIKSNKYLSEAEGGKLTRDSLTQSAGTLLNKQIQDLSETGRGYSQIRESGIPIDVSSKKPAINRILSDNTITVDGKGILDFTDSAIESKADQAQLQKVYDYFNRGEVTPDIYLNKKKAIRDMTDFSQGNADQTNRILKQIGAERKQAGHDSIPELKQLDAVYEPQITDINEIRNKIFDKDGKLREGATSYIMNSLGANKDVTLQKLEKLIPEISEQVKAIRAVEDINASKGIRPGTYNKTAAIAGGVKAGAEAGKAIGSYLGSAGEFIGGGIGGIVGAIGGIIATDPAYIINKLRGVDVKLPDEIVQKIKDKQALSTAQKTKVNDILSSLDKKKQQVIIEQVKKDQKYPIKLKQEGPQTLGATLPKALPKTPPITVEKGAIGMGTPKVNNTPVIPTKATVAPSVSAPKVDTFKRMTELDSNPLYRKLTGGEILGGGKIKQGLFETPLGTITNEIMDGKVKKYIVNGKTYNASDLGGIREKQAPEVVAQANKVSKAISDLKAIESGKGNVMGSSLRSVLDDLGIKDVNSIPEGTESDILQMVRARKPVAPKKGIPKLGKEIMEQDITKSDNLISEAKKYKSAEELGLKVKEGGHILDSLKSKENTFAKIDSAELGKTIELDIRDLEKQKTGKLQSDYWLKKIKSGKRPPILVGIEDGKLKVIDGNHRASAYLQEKIRDVPIILTEEAKGNLKQIREQANKKTLPPLPKKGKEIMEQDITKGDDLINEAKKYKSAENFTKSQGKALYHGSKASSNIEKEGFKKMPIQTGVPAFGEGTYLTTSKANAKGYGGVVEAYIPKDIKLFRAFDSNAYKLDTQKLIKEGYGGVELDTGNGKNITIFDPASIKTKSQLKQIREQANKKTLPPLPKKGK